MTFTINGAHDHSNATMTLIFESGERHTVTTCSSYNFDNAIDAGSIGGNQVGPVSLTDGKADPSWEAEIARHEKAEITGKMGAGFGVQAITIVVTYQRPNLPTITDTTVGARIGSGAESATGDPVMCKIGGKCLFTLENGVHPFDRTAANQ